MTATTSQTLHPALRLLCQRYELDGLLAVGGMSVVWRGWDHQLGRPVAVKRMKAKALHDEVARERFWREARAGAGTSHPNLIEVLDAGEDQEGPYMVMEFVDGTSLAGLIQRGRLNPIRVALIGEAVARGADHLHRRGIVHGDIKPGNILLKDDGSIRLADLGIHTEIGKPDELVDPNTVLGTPRYFSPEQAGGEDPTPASDIYAIGVVLYEALTGELPFKASSALDLAIAHLHELPLPPGQLVPVPPQLETTVLTAMEKDPSLRFRSAADLADTLSCWTSAASAAEADADPGLRHPGLVAVPA